MEIDIKVGVGENWVELRSKCMSVNFTWLYLGFVQPRKKTDCYKWISPKALILLSLLYKRGNIGRIWLQ